MVHFLTDDQIKLVYPEANSQTITSINDSITKAISEYCNTSFELVTYTDERYDSDYEIVPEHRPIDSVSSLSQSSLLLTENTDFYVYTGRITLTSPDRTQKSVKITYKAGYSSVPEKVKMAALDILRFRAFKETEGSLLFYKKQTFEERDYEFDPEMTEDVLLNTLSEYVQPKSGYTVGKRRSGLRIGYVNG